MTDYRPELGFRNRCGYDIIIILRSACSTRRGFKWQKRLRLACVKHAESPLRSVRSSVMQRKQRIGRSGRQNTITSVLIAGRYASQKRTMRKKWKFSSFPKSMGFQSRMYTESFESGFIKKVSVMISPGCPAQSGASGGIFQVALFCLKWCSKGCYIL